MVSKYIMFTELGTEYIEWVTSSLNRVRTNKLYRVDSVIIRDNGFNWMNEPIEEELLEITFNDPEDSKGRGMIAIANPQIRLTDYIINMPDGKLTTILYGE